MGMTESAPAGTTPPVAIAIASPASSARGAGTPAAIRATIGSRPGVSSDRTAKPSIAELGKGGRSTAASAVHGQHAARGGRHSSTSSAPSGVTRPRMRSSASSSESRSAILRPAYNLAAVISVVVPVHDEERSVALLYDELRAALEPLAAPWEAIFVDDGSTDGTFSALTRLHNSEQNVRVVRLRRNFGKAAALVAGFDQAHGEIVVTIDGDLQDDPAEIPRLLAKLDEGFDLVTGWKTHRRDPISRRLLSRIFNRVTSAFSGVRLHDMNCGLKAYRAEVVHGLRLYGELHRFIPVLAHYRGFRIAELPVNHRPREHGRSRYGVERYLRGFLDLLTVSFIGRYRHRPLHLFGGFGLLLGSDRLRDPRLPHRDQGARTRDRTTPAADARRAARRDRDAVLLAGADQRDDHEPPRGASAGARPGRAARRRNPLLRRRLGGAALEAVRALPVRKPLKPAARPATSEPTNAAIRVTRR